MNNPQHEQCVLASEAQINLMDCMACISEEFFFAGWATGLEYAIWQSITTNGFLSDEQVLTLKRLSGQAQGWIVWSEEQDECIFINISEWEEMYKNWVSLK